MNVLAIETSGDRCSCALGRGTGVIERAETTPRRHADLVLGMIDELLAEAGIDAGRLDAVAYGRGPGSFTGVRIAAAVTQGLAWAHRLPVVGISSLAALAAASARIEGARRVAAVLDARMGEIYWGLYEIDHAQAVPTALAADALGRPDELPRLPGTDWCGAGHGWAAHREVLARCAGEGLSRICPGIVADARDVLAAAAPALAAGDVVDAAGAIPVYLRNRVARRPARLDG